MNKVKKETLPYGVCGVNELVVIVVVASCQSRTERVAVSDVESS